MTLHWWMHWFWITGPVLACLFLGLHARSIPDQEFALTDEPVASHPRQTSLRHDEATHFETASILEELSTVEGANIWYGDTEIPEPSADQSPDFTSDSGRGAPGTSSSLYLQVEHVSGVTLGSLPTSPGDIFGKAFSRNPGEYDAVQPMTYEQTTGQVLTRSTSEALESSTDNSSVVLLPTPAVLMDSLPHKPSSHIHPLNADMETEVKQNAGQRLLPRDLRNASDLNPGAIPASPSLRLNARAGKAVGSFPPELVATTPSYRTFESFPFPVSSDAPTSSYRGYHTGLDSRVTWISTVSTNITKLKDITSRDETKQNETTTGLPEMTLLAENETEQIEVMEVAVLEETNETTARMVGTPVSKSRVSMSGRRGLDAAGITGIALGAVVVLGLMGAVSFVLYRRRFLNKPQTLNDKCSNPDSSGYIDDSTLRENSEEMYSLDNDSFLNSLEAMTIQNYWTDSVKHTKL